MRKSTVTLKAIRDIVDLPIPNIQRNLNEKHVKSIVADQIHEYEKWRCFSILQAITTVNVRNDKEYIIDGSHRLASFKELNKLGYTDIMSVQIPVVTYDILDQYEMTYYFNKVNTNMPIHLLELQEDFADYGKILIEKMTETFGIYLKHDNKNSRCPHINMNEFKKNIAGRNIGEKLKAKCSNINEFWQKILDLNKYVKDNIKAENQLCQMMRRRITDCEVKGEKFHSKKICYLGVYRKFEWLDICMEALLENKDFNEIDLSCEKNTRVPIPIVIREQVWKKVNVTQSDMGICYTCSNDLYFREMECGHIKARALGGEDTVDNLMPVCKCCNKDMGIMCLESYKGMIEKMTH